MFIGRETELHFLQERYQAEGGQLIILYGRRRVGKTETLREFCKGKPHVFYSCTQTTDQVQLLKFSEQIMKEDIPAKNMFRALQTGNRPFGRSANCRMEKKRSWSSSMSFRIFARRTQVFRRSCRTFGIPN